MVSAFKAYIDFFALKKHFTSTYDYKKYHGQLRRKVETFERRKDKWIFEKLAKRVDYHEFLLANLAHNPKLWITEIVGNHDAEIKYVEWKKTVQSLSYIFETEIKKLPEDLFEQRAKLRPILHAYLQHEICLETLCILTDLTNTVHHWNENPVWKSIGETITNYTPFLAYDKTKMRTIAYRRFKHAIFLKDK